MANTHNGRKVYCLLQATVNTLLFLCSHTGKRLGTQDWCYVYLDLLFGGWTEFDPQCDIRSPTLAQTWLSFQFAWNSIESQTFIFECGAFRNHQSFCLLKVKIHRSSLCSRLSKVCSNFQWTPSSTVPLASFLNSSQDVICEQWWCAFYGGVTWKWQWWWQIK